MGLILTTILPVFGLIALGYAAARFRYLGASAAQGLAQFVFNLAIPAFLFRTVAGMGEATAAPWNLWAGMFGGIALGWVLTLVLGRMMLPREEGTAPLCMAAGFGNLALLGLPLAIAHFGPDAAVPVSLVLSIHAPFLWLAATVHLESERHGHLPSASRLARQLFLELSRNPIVLSLAAGAIAHLAGLTLPAALDRMLELLGQAGVPAALVALGLSLAGYSLKGRWSVVALIIAAKMLAIPLSVWLLLSTVFTVPPLWAQVAVLLAAMPTGANAYLFAQRHNQHAAVVSGSVALGTALAMATTALLLWSFDRGLL